MQNLTPLDIQKHVFDKNFRGFNVDEVRAYLHLIAEEVEQLLKDVEKVSRDNAQLREEIGQHSDRERILKDTLLSAQQVSEEVKSNARKEAELIVKDAELLSERIISQAMDRVAQIEQSIQSMKIDRKAARNKLQSLLETFQQLVMLDAEQEANEFPITQLHKKISETQSR